MSEPSQAFGLSEKTLAVLRSLFNGHSGIERVIVYGSRAKGNYRPGSDIDLTLIASTLSLSDLMKIQNEIDDLSIPYKVDLSLFHYLDNEELKEHIQRVGKDFLSDEGFPPNTSL